MLPRKWSHVRTCSMQFMFICIVDGVVVTVTVSSIVIVGVVAFITANNRNGQHRRLLANESTTLVACLSSQHGFHLLLYQWIDKPTSMCECMPVHVCEREKESQWVCVRILVNMIGNSITAAHVEHINQSSLMPHAELSHFQAFTARWRQTIVHTWAFHLAAASVAPGSCKHIVCLWLYLRWCQRIMEIEQMKLFNMRLQLTVRSSFKNLNIQISTLNF